MPTDKKWLFTLILTALLSLTLLLSTFSTTPSTPSPANLRRDLNYPPAFAYYISGSSGDSERLFRLLLSVYHPRNRYLLHIGTDGSDEERRKLGSLVNSVSVIRTFRNVDLVGKPDKTTYMGSSSMAAVLRGGSILLKVDKGWDWFVHLTALDYPLVTQDDLSHVFSSVRRDLNFIDHTSDLGWKEGQRVLPIVVDPGLYLGRRGQIFHATEKRKMPDAFKVFTGSPWVTLSRSFLEYCVLGWDNLPRTLLMFSSNIVLSQEVYFHSVICNSPEFSNTTVNNDLRYMVWDNPPKMEPVFLNISDYKQMVQSGAAFARQFAKDEAVLDMIDEKILKREGNRVTPGAWCTGRRSWFTDPCLQWGDVNSLKPGKHAKKFKESMSNLLYDWKTQSNQCIL
ncbi:beta-glucuronosyltransferase GlcAT14A-like [Heracleum sosnowskyi]|uniref:Beta-glucuronosyltransferase GlcAT14A-like n=1 Tax=Heracleum sosnowskyi TaxID=360622 RepID=A0AAD8MLI3_9APIA|nr:beta-glucuronosyltransferase GlcAT14A-like [Heracleum sosnowskyi]KAK1380818.1 beta-glucuronosyltransferase GlcAT14A-like [Heracleum sosnowskyi]